MHVEICDVSCVLVKTVKPPPKKKKINNNNNEINKQRERYYTCLSSWGNSFELAKVLIPERCLTMLETGVINASFKPTNALRVTKNTFYGLGRTPPKKSSKTFKLWISRTIPRSHSCRCTQDLSLNFTRYL